MGNKGTYKEKIEGKTFQNFCLNWFIFKNTKVKPLTKIIKRNKYGGKMGKNMI
jgi:hypothetical protein